MYAAVSNWESFEIRHDHILLPIKVNGVETNALLDSGANVNVISSRFIETYGSDLSSTGRMKLKGAFGTETRRTYSNINLELWGASFKQDNMVAANMPRDISVVLGTRFFHQFLFQIDYPNSRLRILSRDAVDLRKLKNVPAKVIDRMVNVKVDLNGQKDLWLLLDTGSDSGITTRRMFAEQYGWLEQFELEPLKVMGANRVTDVQEFTLPYVELGPFVIEDVPTSVPAEGKSITFGRAGANATGSNIKNRKVSGILGYEVLKHFIMTIDFKKGHVHLETP